MADKDTKTNKKKVMSIFKNPELKQINELTDRELNERILMVLERQQKHQQWISNVLSFYFWLTIVGGAVTLIILLFK